jgi:phosphatidylserine/phosphatidylglycerophosphate/cardiolipin synthase-like enzyme
MKAIIEHLHASIDDYIMSKSEKRQLKTLLQEYPLSQDQINFLQSQVYEIAMNKADGKNFPSVIEWIKSANSALRQDNQRQDGSVAYFSPGDACRNVIMDQLRSSSDNVRLCVFTISDDLITDAILETHSRGVDVKIITDNDKSEDRGSDIEKLARADIEIRMDRTEHHMHHKFMIVDNNALITGSYNWTRSAAKYNHENIVLSQEPTIVKSFLGEFEQLWKTMRVAEF